MQLLSDHKRAGFFLGDGAGVGKGRTIAGLIWENWQLGRVKSLWVEEGLSFLMDSTVCFIIIDILVVYPAVEPLKYFMLSIGWCGVQMVVCWFWSQIWCTERFGGCWCNTLCTSCGRYVGICCCCQLSFFSSLCVCVHHAGVLLPEWSCLELLIETPWS